MSKQYSHVHRKKENILYRWVEFNLVAHMLKSFSFHINTFYMLAKTVYLEYYELTECVRCTLGKKNF